MRNGSTCFVRQITLPVDFIYVVVVLQSCGQKDAQGDITSSIIWLIVGIDRSGEGCVMYGQVGDIGVDDGIEQKMADSTNVKYLCDPELLK